MEEKKESIVNLPVMGEFKPTEEQDLIINEFKKYSNNISVKANPGTGKTRLLTHISQMIQSENKNYIALSFSNLAVNSMTEKGIAASTVNSQALKFAKKLYPKATIDKYKMSNLIMECGLIAEDDRKKNKTEIIRIISLLDANLLPYTIDGLNTLNELDYKITLEINQILVNIVNDIDKRRIASRKNKLDFDDTLRIAHKNKDICTKFDFILVDESQDLTKLNLEVIANMSEENTLYIFVGDVNQSIYIFRGANKTSIEDINKRFNCNVFELTLTFRTPEKIVEFLNAEFPEIKLTSKKSGGEVNFISESFMLESILQDESAYIICRNNAPLIKPAYTMIKQGLSVCIKGKDIALDVINFIDYMGYKFNAKFETLSDVMNSYYNETCEKFKNAKNKTFLDELNEKIELIKEMLNISESLDDVKLKIDSLFSDDDAKYTFMTGHKSKGLEHESVYVYKPELVGKNAKTETEKSQEYNLKWVMYTRSLNKLTFVS